MQQLKSKLPNIGTTIFTTMTNLANELGAINLSQGFPDFDGHDFLKERLAYHVNHGANQYAPMAGIPRLNQAISDKVNRHYNRQVDPQKEITVTLGATEALFDAIQCVVNAGDEVIVFDPAYDSYEPAIELASGQCLHLQLNSDDFSIPWQALEGAITDKTRLIILNSPQNPCGTVISSRDLDQLWQIVKDRDIFLLSDEVYEHIIFDNLQHESLLRHDNLAQRSFVVSSFGKTFHMTGWRVGYCIAPTHLSAEFRKVHQYVTFSIPNPLQNALADMLEKHPEHAIELPAFYQHKRDFFANALSTSLFDLRPCFGSYFQLVDYSKISDLGDLDFCYWLAQKAGVVAVPVSVFYQTPLSDQRLIRFCFCKGEALLAKAARRLCRI
ncbi:MAG: methionine aminotransferase [Pseudomonadota bacterium]